MITDFHLHIFSDDLAKKMESVLSQSKEMVTLDGVADSMEECDIDYAVAVPVACSEHQCEDINDFVIEVEERNNLFPFGTIHPKFSGWADELERIKDAGIIGINLTPDFQGINIDDDSMMDVIEYATKLGFIIMVDSGMNISSVPYEKRKCTPKKLRIVSRCIKNAKIIATHIGGYEYLTEAERYLIGTNIYIDTSFIIGKMNNCQVCRMLLNHSPEKILFGSNAPWNSQSDALEAVRQLNVPEDLKERILFKNARELLADV